MNAADVMSRTLVGVRRDAPLLSALRLMVENRMSGLPVLDATGKLVGILTEGDLLRRAELGTDAGGPGPVARFFAPDRLAGDYIHTHGRRVEELMTTSVRTVTPETPIAEVAELMRKHRVKRLPVLRNDDVIGVVSRADLVRRLFESLDHPDDVRQDGTIADEIRKELERQEFLMHRAITVCVADGSVELDGVVFDIRQRDAAQVVAENLAGTMRVNNRLAVVDATSGIVVLDPTDHVLADADPSPVHLARPDRY